MRKEYQLLMTTTYDKETDPVLSREDAIAILNTPDDQLQDLVDRAAALRYKYKGNRVSIHILTNARSGNCSQDCAYCAQSCRSTADIEKYKWVDEDKLYHNNDFVNEHHLSRHCIGLSGMKFTDQEIEELARRIRKMKEQAGSHGQVVDLVLNEVAAAIRADDDDLQIYTSGATNIFKYPELSDNQKASQLLSTLEHTETLQELVNGVNEDPNSSENGIQVYIGEESPVQAMKDCSVVTATYELGEGVRGTIGIIGPKRMDYEKVLKTLRTLMTQLDATFKNEER